MFVMHARDQLACWCLCGMWLKHVSEQGPDEDPMRSEHPTKEGLIMEQLLLNQFPYRIILRLFAFAYMIRQSTRSGSFDRLLQPSP